MLCAAALSCSKTDPRRFLIHSAKVPSIAFINGGEKIVVAKSTSLGWVVSTHNLNEGHEQRVIVAEGESFSLAVSPVGPAIAFVQSNSNRTELIILASPESVPVVISDDDSVPLWPVFSPDGKSISYAATAKNGRSEIRIVSVEGASVRVVTDGQAVDIMPSYSLTGDAILFWRASSFGRASFVSSERYHNWSLCRVDLGSGEVVCKSNALLYNIEMRAPCVCNDVGYFTSDRVAGSDIWSFSEESLEYMRPVDFEDLFFGSEVVPDARNVRISSPQCFGPYAVAFQMTINELAAHEMNLPENIYVFNNGSKELKQITNSALPIAAFAVSPDGARLALLFATGAIEIIDLDKAKIL